MRQDFSIVKGVYSKCLYLVLPGGNFITISDSTKEAVSGELRAGHISDFDTNNGGNSYNLVYPDIRKLVDNPFDKDVKTHYNIKPWQLYNCYSNLWLVLPNKKHINLSNKILSVLDLPSKTYFGCQLLCDDIRQLNMNAAIVNLKEEPMNKNKKIEENLSKLKGQICDTAFTAVTEIVTALGYTPPEPEVKFIPGWYVNGNVINRKDFVKYALVEITKIVGNSIHYRYPFIGSGISSTVTKLILIEEKWAYVGKTLEEAVSKLLNGVKVTEEMQKTVSNLKIGA